MTEPITWTNDKRKLSELIPWEMNPRQLTEKQAGHLETSLRKFGFAQPFLISPDNDIYDGHQRKALMQLMKEYGQDVDIDVRVSSRMLTDDERRELVIRLHENTGEWDFDTLANVYEVEELGEWGFPDWKIDEFMPQEEPPPEDAPPQTNRAEELREEWGVEPGQLWRLPSRTEGQEHRLICGDCTDAAVVELVMGGERIDCITTDPPYGVDYDGGTTTREKLKGDDSPALYYPALNAWRDYCCDHLAFYLWYADGDQAVVQAVVQAGYHTRRNLIWNKNQAQYGALSQQYKQKHEPFLYGHLKGKSPYWAGDATEITVWDIPRDSVNDLHPTQKPPALYARAIRNSSKNGDIVFDGFCGSAPAIIASENLSRQCRAVEISPAYVAVSLQRYADAFNIEPELVS